jgi:competence protein ComEA
LPQTTGQTEPRFVRNEVSTTTAQKILDYRQAHGAFHSLAELDAVPGIGPGRLEQLKGLVIP